MNKSRFYRPESSDMSGFIACAALFAAGCAAGAIASGHVPPEAQVGDFFSAAADTGIAAFGTRFASAFLASGKYCLLALFFSFSVLGVLCIPAVSALRGFLLCFTISSAVRFYGAPGVPFTLLMFAPEALIAVPSLFLLSAKSVTVSGLLLRSAAGGGSYAPPFGNGFVRRCFLCAALLCISALISSVTAPFLSGLLPV